MRRWLAVMAALALAGAGGYFFGYRSGSEAATPEGRQILEERFAESMRGAVLAGTFTIDGSEREPSIERYTIDRVEKLAGDLWLFHARVQFGDTDVSLPVPVRVVWAGDTPVVTLTDSAIPGLGTFSVRLVFFRGRYAGLWSNPSTGGFQFGTIETEAGGADAAPTP